MDDSKSMSQIRELLFGEQMKLLEESIQKLTEKLEKELSDAKAAIQASYDAKLAAMEKAFNEAERSINSNMVDRTELSRFFAELASRLEKDDRNS